MGGTAAMKNARVQASGVLSGNTFVNGPEPRKKEESPRTNGLHRAGKLKAVSVFGSGLMRMRRVGTGSGQVTGTSVFPGLAWIACLWLQLQGSRSGLRESVDQGKAGYGRRVGWGKGVEVTSDRTQPRD